MNFILPILVVLCLGVIAGIILTIASKVFFVKVDERVAAVREVLPGANCGACGYAGCDDYAAALCCGDDVPPNLCPPGGADVIAEIAKVLGVEAGSAEPKYAEVLCQGICDRTPKIMDFKGVTTCEAVKTFYGGDGACKYGCLGLGDCVTACPYDAIEIVNGVAYVKRENCIGCGLCVTACPNSIIHLANAKNLVYVACSNHDKGGVARKACETACIGCMKCTKVCKFDAIKVENFLAEIDSDLCKNCGLCMKECPTNAIVRLPRPGAKPVVKKPTPKAPEGEGEKTLEA